MVKFTCMGDLGIRNRKGENDELYEDISYIEFSNEGESYKVVHDYNNKVREPD